MKIVWKDIVDYEGLYEISNKANVRNKKTGKILKPYINENGYLMIGLTKNGKHKLHRLHVLLMNAFVEKIPGKPIVNHKNGNKLDLDFDNLEWCTSAENNQHAIDTGLRSYNKIRRDYHIVINDLDFTAKGAKVAAERLHESGYFTEVSTCNLKAAITRCAIKHELYLGVLKAEHVDDPFNDIKEYHKCGLKGRDMCAQLPSGFIIKGKGPANLADKIQKFGYLESYNRKSLTKMISESALRSGSCYGIPVWYVK